MRQPSASPEEPIVVRGVSAITETMIAQVTAQKVIVQEAREAMSQAAAEIERLRKVNGELVAALESAIETIHGWHGDVAWDIYNYRSPEMKRIHAALKKAGAV